MQHFYFNECFPVEKGGHIVQCFAKALREFNSLLEKNIGIERSIITEKLPSKINVGECGTLQNLIEKVPNNDLRNFAFSFFIRNPIHAHFNVDRELVDNLLQEAYCLNISDKNYDATNLAITFHNKGLLFTTATHVDLQKDTLTCRSDLSGNNFSLDNLHGEEKNTTYIEEKVIALELSSKSLWEQLIAVLGQCIYNKTFEREFNGLSQNEQQAIVTGFQEAKDRKLASPFYPDTKLIKDVTPQHAKRTVLELRIYSPVALRVYFNEDSGIVYAVKIGFKANPNQSSDIKQADLTINKLMLTGA